MEEPLIINYYNELPSYAIVINNLNEEYDNLNIQYQELLKDKHKHKPIILESNNNNKFIYTIDRKVIIFISFLAFVEITIMLILI
tara:strand:+ start:50 stop:304 length:255 start_codon:yes stop_codon:yes gene_type:complete